MAGVKCTHSAAGTVQECDVQCTRVRGVVYVHPPRVLLPYPYPHTYVLAHVRICAAVFFLGDRHKFHRARARGRSQESEIPTRPGGSSTANMAAFEDLFVGIAYGFL